MPNLLSVEDEIVAALRRIIRAVDLHSRHLAQEVGLTWPQLATLRAAQRLGPCPISALAREVHLGQPTLTGIVQRLERAGYVARAPNQTDRRSVNVVVTDAGEQLLANAPSLLQDRFHTELARLKDWERFQTLASLQRIAEMMDVETLDASPLLVAGPVDSATTGTDVDSNPLESSHHLKGKSTTTRRRTQPARAGAQNARSVSAKEECNASTDTCSQER
ncbi:MAG: MarR family winged helix-turn-helix transcriptional regulator [Phycisphaerae bacterium]|jgi:DNA-binding MarR family transcriptional regulator